MLHELQCHFGSCGRAARDPTTWNIDDQWLLGEHLLVAPVLDASGHRRVYLPAGRWLEAALDRMPLWIRDGGAIALGPVMHHVGERPVGRVTIRAVPPADGRTVEGTFVADTEVTWRWEADGLELDPPVDADIHHS